MHRLIIAAALFLGCVGLGANALAVPVVLNPSFETDTFGTWPGYISANGPITNWTFTGTGGAGLNPVTSGNPLSPFGDNGVIPNSTDVGQASNPTTHGQVAFIQGSGSLSQVINGFEAYSWYVMEYRENERNGQTTPLSVTMNSATIMPTHNSTSVGGTNLYRSMTSGVFASTSQGTLALTASVPSGDNSVLLDNVSFRRIATNIALLTPLFQDTFSPQSANPQDMNNSIPGSRQTGTVVGAGITYTELSSTSGGENYRTQLDNPGGPDAVLLAAGNNGATNRSAWVSPNHNFVEAPLTGRQVLEASLNPAAFAGSYEALIFGMPQPSSGRSALSPLAQNSGGFAFEIHQDTGTWSFFDNTTQIAAGPLAAHTGYYDVKVAMDTYSDFANGSPLGITVSVDGLLAFSYGGTARGFNYIGAESFGGDNLTYAIGYLDNLLVYNVDQVVPEPATLSLLGLGLAALAARRRRSQKRESHVHSL